VQIDELRAEREPIFPFQSLFQIEVSRLSLFEVTIMPIVLPAEFRFGHELAFAIHDMLCTHVVLREQAGLQFFKVKLNSLEDGKATREP